MGPGTSFGWQHNARWRPGGEISLFDNEASPPLSDHSRGLVLRVDQQRMRVELVRAYTSPERLLSGSQGDVQFLPDGHVFVGWGANPYFTEFSADGWPLFDAHFKQGADSYRAFRFTWTGHPADAARPRRPHRPARPRDGVRELERRDRGRPLARARRPGRRGTCSRSRTPRRTASRRRSTWATCSTTGSRSRRSAPAAPSSARRGPNSAPPAEPESRSTRNRRSACDRRGRCAIVDT